jgi:hypothetical protein
MKKQSNVISCGDCGFFGIFESVREWGKISFCPACGAKPLQTPEEMDRDFEIHRNSSNHPPVDEN